MISSNVIGHSLSPQGDELISVIATFPRFILAEVNTHRMLGKNTSSSRAIPFKKMVEAVRDNPFIPMAWQKDHPGMQGSKYLDPNIKCSLSEFILILDNTLNTYDKDSEEYKKLAIKIKEKVELINTILSDYKESFRSIIEWWLFARDKAVEMATILYVLNVTKQLCNRLIETFMWTTMVITGTLKGGWDNFFNLRCPQYVWDSKLHKDMVFKSKKDLIKELDKTGLKSPAVFASAQSDLEWLKMNKGLAEIHMMALAEAIYDSVQESTPKQLKAGEWHIPFEGQINVEDYLQEYIEGHSSDSYKHVELENELKVKVSTAMCARTSYTVVGEEKEVKINDLIGLDNRLLNQWPPHSSPMEHCAQAMDYRTYYSSIKGVAPYINVLSNKGDVAFTNNADKKVFGWCRNYRGFIQRRHLIETNN